jgi:adenylate kinase family enzyme
VKRVAIVGTPGSGKSTLARQLGRRMGLPVIHLDEHHFLPGWQRRPDDEWDRIADELLAGERWVMDGAFAMEKAVERADTIVFLDFARWRGYAGSIKRLALAYLGRPAPDFAPGCEDRLDRDFWRLLKTIHMYPRNQRRDVEADVQRRRADGARVVVVRNRAEIRRLLERVRVDM